jgi:DNA repair exonuclease SbcCD ATPase subunit
VIGGRKRLAERAEQLYEQLVDLRQRMTGLEESVDETSDRVRKLERRSEEQEALLRAIAREQGIDVEAVLADAAIEHVDAEGGDAADEAGASEESAADTGDAGDADGSTGDPDAVEQ